MWFFLLLVPVSLFAVMFVGLVWTHRPDLSVWAIMKELLKLAAERIRK